MIQSAPKCILRGRGLEPFLNGNLDLATFFVPRIKALKCNESAVRRRTHCRVLVE